MPSISTHSGIAAVAIIAAFALLGAGVATADDQGAARAETGKQARGVCKEDIATHCADVKKGEGRVLACLAAAPNVSQACAERVERRQQRRAKRAQACSVDAAKLCKGQDGKALRQCIRQHRDELSSACAAAIKSAKRGQGKGAGSGKHAAFKEACGDDVKRLCGEAEKGEVRACMKSHAAELSQACSAVISERRAERRAEKADAGQTRKKKADKNDRNDRNDRKDRKNKAKDAG